MYLYEKDLSEARYKFLIKNRENAGITHLIDSNAFTECSNTMDDVYQIISDYNPIMKRKNLVVFDDMIADITSNKKNFRKQKHFTCIYYTVLFFCFKKCRIKFDALFDYEN